MMDFPTSPAAGTIVTFPNGQAYRWNGGQWDVIAVPMNITGVTDGSNAPAGCVGEFYSAQVLGGTPPNGSAVSLCGGSLTAGDWDVWGVVYLSSMGGAPGLSFMGAGISVAAATMNYNYVSAVSLNSAIINVTHTCATPVVRINFTTTSNIYLNGQLNFPSGAPVVNSYLYARRRR